MDRELEQLLQLSRDLLEQARADEWDTVVEMEQQRSPRLHAYFESRSAGRLPEADRERVREIIELDRQVAQLAQARQNRIASDLKELKRGQSAVAAYDAHDHR